MREVTDIWFKTKLRLDKLTQKLGFELEEYDYENVWEWTISSLGNVKLDICRNHTKTRFNTFTTIFRIDEHKKPFDEVLINHIVEKLKSIGITPIYLGKYRISEDDTFETEIAKIIE